MKKVSFTALFAPERSILLGLMAGASALLGWRSASASSRVAAAMSGRMAGARATSGGEVWDASHVLSAVDEGIVASVSED